MSNQDNLEIVTAFLDGVDMEMKQLPRGRWTQVEWIKSGPQDWDSDRDGNRNVHLMLILQFPRMVESYLVGQFGSLLESQIIGRRQVYRQRSRDGSTCRDPRRCKPRDDRNV